MSAKGDVDGHGRLHAGNAGEHMSTGEDSSHTSSVFEVKRSDFGTSVCLECEILGRGGVASGHGTSKDAGSVTYVLSSGP